jgi:hypothetical protein
MRRPKSHALDARAEVEAGVGLGRIAARPAAQYLQHVASAMAKGGRHEGGISENSPGSSLFERNGGSWLAVTCTQPQGQGELPSANPAATTVPRYLLRHMFNQLLGPEPGDIWALGVVALSLAREMLQFSYWQRTVPVSAAQLLALSRAHSRPAASTRPATAANLL